MADVWQHYLFRGVQEFQADQQGRVHLQWQVQAGRGIQRRQVGPRQSAEHQRGRRGGSAHHSPGQPRAAEIHPRDERQPQVRHRAARQHRELQAIRAVAGGGGGQSEDGDPGYSGAVPEHGAGRAADQVRAPPSGRLRRHGAQGGAAEAAHGHRHAADQEDCGGGDRVLRGQAVLFGRAVPGHDLRQLRVCGPTLRHHGLIGGVPRP
mmetsp:Transcript_83181/g.138731  ORF Transcript_83181/g.138731 Transcript_83181/m.138731 type:complete len:207 (+) Transcript_83181:958-1578(+)